MNQLTLYSKANCPNCTKAGAYLDAKGIPYEVLKIDEDLDARAFLITAGHKAVPQIYLNGTLFVEGGFQGLSKMSKEEIIKKMEA